MLIMGRCSYCLAPYCDPFLIVRIPNMWTVTILPVEAVTEITSNIVEEETSTAA